MVYELSGPKRIRAKRKIIYIYDIYTHTYHWVSSRSTVSTKLSYFPVHFEAYSRSTSFSHYQTVLSDFFLFFLSSEPIWGVNSRSAWEIARFWMLIPGLGVSLGGVLGWFLTVLLLQLLLLSSSLLLFFFFLGFCWCTLFFFSLSLSLCYYFCFFSSSSLSLSLSYCVSRSCFCVLISGIFLTLSLSLYFVFWPPQITLPFF